MFLIVALSACNDDDDNGLLEPDPFTGDVVGSISGIVTDIISGERIPGVVVSTYTGGEIKTATTSDVGGYSFSGLHSGAYQLTFDFDESTAKVLANSYAIVTLEDSIPQLDSIGSEKEIVGEGSGEEGNNTVYFQVLVDAALYPKNAGLTGKVFKAGNDGAAVEASGVTVIADFSAYPFTETIYTTVTDSGGAYTFADLPATAQVVVRTAPYMEGAWQYAASTTTASLNSNGSVTADDLLITRAPTTPSILSTSFSESLVGLSDNIQVIFAQSMTPENFVIELTTVPGDAVPSVVSWTEANVLLVNPIPLLLHSSTYRLTITQMSGLQVVFTTTLEFNTILGIAFVSTNVETADEWFEEVPTDTDIVLTFDRAIDQTSHLNSIVFRADGLPQDPDVAFTISYSDDSTQLTLDPIHRLESYRWYSLDVTLASTLPDDTVDVTIDFRTAHDHVMPVEVINFVLNEAAGWVADFNTTSIDFRFDTQPGVTGYRIYAREDAAKSDYILVNSVPTPLDESLAFLDVSVDLTISPADVELDVYSGDGIQTPFTADQNVIFQVVAFNDLGEGPFSSEISVGDETAPTGNLFGQSGTADNSGGTTDLVITLTFSATEYLDIANGPSFGVQDGGDAYVLPTSAIDFAWNADRLGGELTLTIPAGEDASGDEILMTIFSDSSGNNNDTIPGAVLF